MRLFILLAILLLVTGLDVGACVFAQENISLEDKLIGSTFKTLAKGFVAMADINTLKKNNIDKLNRMNEEKFQKRYAKVYEAIKDLPSQLKSRYGLTEHMTKKQAIKDIESFDKKEIYETIDLVSDVIIAKQFKRYLSEKKQEIQNSNAVEQINKFWDKIIEKVNAKPKVKDRLK